MARTCCCVVSIQEQESCTQNPGMPKFLRARNGLSKNLTSKKFCWSAAVDRRKKKEKFYSRTTIRYRAFCCERPTIPRTIIRLSRYGWFRMDELEIGSHLAFFFFHIRQIINAKEGLIIWSKIRTFIYDNAFRSWQGSTRGRGYCHFILFYFPFPITDRSETQIVTDCKKNIY